MYDIFYVSNAAGNDADWNKIKSNYPFAQRLSNIKTYEQIRSKCFTKMFWVIWDDVDLFTTFNLLEYTTDEWDNMYVHVFRNGEHYDGICLFPKNITVSKKEFDYRFFSNKKDIDIIASTPKQYNIYHIDTYDEYVTAVNTTSSNMFWAVWNDVTIDSNFKFDYQVATHNQHIVHVFKNGKHHDGICLFNKNSNISKREFDNRFFANKKDIDIIASNPVPYDVFTVSSFEEYEQAAKKSKTSMFWAIFNDIAVIDDFNFNYQVPKYNHPVTHIFQNGENFDGICLFSKYHIVSQREFEYRFFTIKKEIPILASMPKPFDIVFISYYELVADENFKKLLDKKLNNKIFRVKDVDGIHNAHKQAATLVNTKMFWVVDADAELVDEFTFDYQVKKHDQDTVHVWKSRNPVNGLEYGNGGVKLLPTKLTANMQTNNPDMTTSISGKFKSIPIISNVNKFNTDPYNTWKSSFRECCKLASRIIDRQLDAETQERLDTWCEKSTDYYAIAGAIAGRGYGLKNKNNIDALKKINDFKWLKEQFDERYSKN